MSYFNKSEKLTNPATKFYTWSGENGKFLFYNKEKGIKIEVSELNVIDIDQLATIKGYSKEFSGGFVSNEVRNTVKERLEVGIFTKKADGSSSRLPFAEGFYQEIKDKLKAAGCKYTRSVYAYDVITDELINIQFSGSGLAGWSNFKNSNTGKLLKIAKNPEAQKKGKTVYYIPEVIETEFNQELINNASKYNDILQDYLRVYLAPKTKEEVIINDELPDIDIDIDEAFTPAF
jgi:hypothetical protein